MLLNTCLRISLDLVLLRNILNAIEVLGAAEDYVAEGIFSWKVLRLQRHWMRMGIGAEPTAPILHGNSFLYLNGIQFLLSALLLTLRVPDIRLLWLVFAIEVFVDLRNSAFGRDGSDRMHVLIFCALCICYSFTDLRARSLGLLFIALQAMLAYFVSGLVKALSKQWRTGRSIALVLCSENYGEPHIGMWIEGRAWFCRAACWSVIVFEITFSIFAFVGPIPTACVLLVGIIFHFSVAATMGLNGFIWSFPAAYPAILFLSVTWQQLVLHPHGVQWPQLLAG